MNMDFLQLLNLNDQNEQSLQMRKAFAPYTPLVEVTGNEILALVVLLNLTLKRDTVECLLDEKLAEVTLKNQKHLDTCVSEVRWLHSHNLKYPDTRVSGQRLIVEAQPMTEGVISSSLFPQMLGWSHNASAVNKAKLFGSSFLWQQRVCNLADLLIEKELEWQKAFQALGMAKRQVYELREQVQQAINENQIPSEVSDFSPQLRFPYEGDYISITPVVSHAVQASLQQHRSQHVGHFADVSHAHPASVGDLSSSLGGHISVLNYPPPVWPSSTSNLHHSRLARVLAGKEVFEIGAIRNKAFLKALDALTSSNRQQTRQLRMKSRVASLRFIRKRLAEWIAPLIEWREVCLENAYSIDDCGIGELERQLLEVDYDKYPTLISLLNQRLHQQLQTGSTTSKYAYHPQLLAPLKSQLLWVLRSFGKVATPSEVPSSSSQYLYLQGLRVFDAKSLANPSLNGVPSLTAVWGFAHNFQRRMNKLMSCNLRVKGVAWFIRGYSAKPTSKLPEFSVLKRDDQSIKRSGVITSRYCDLVMDVVLELERNDEEVLLSSADVQFLQAALPSAFSGGCLQPPSLYESKDWCKVYSDRQLLFSTLVRLPINGCWVCPSKTKLKGFDDIFESCSRDSFEKPAMVGYALLEEPLKRYGSIEQHHAFAEPLIGMVSCKSAIEVRLKGEKEFFKGSFWNIYTEKRCILIKKA